MAQMKCEVNGCEWKTEAHIQDPGQQIQRLQLHFTMAHGAAGAGGPKPEKFPRPKIDLDETAERYDDFNASWKQYKAEYSLAGQASTRQLFACCSEELATSLSRVTGGTHFDMTEDDMLAKIKQLAIQYQNPAVHVQTFLSMSQQPDEGVRPYYARLKGVQARCDFKIKCTCGLEPSYADPILRYKLVAGLADGDIKEHVLGEADQTLEETIKMIEAKESGKRAKAAIGGTQMPHANRVNTQPRDPCTHCGRPNHGSSKEEREKSCPAFNRKCDNCARQGHFKRQCMGQKKTKAETGSFRDRQRRRSRRRRRRELLRPV